MKSLAFRSCTLLAAQTNKPAFDIADVHPSPRAEWVKSVSHSLQGGFLTADRYELQRATMLGYAPS